MRRFLVIIAFALALFGCTDNKSVHKKKSDAEIAEQRKRDSLALKVGVRQTLDCLPAFVADDEGIFDSLGVDVRLLHYSSMLDCNEALKKGKLNGAFTDVKRIDYLAKHNSLNMQTVLSFDSRWQLVANRMSRLQSLRQLSEKMVAMSRNSATDYLCAHMLDSVKLSGEKVFRIQINDVDLRLKMLLNNEIDAVWLPEPQASVAKKYGNNVLATSGNDGEKLEVLAFTGATMNDERIKKQVDLFLRAYGIAKGRIKKGGNKYYLSLVEKYYKYKL